VRDETLKREKQDLNVATMIPLVIAGFGKLGPAAKGNVQSLATIACSRGVGDRGV
jgi:hypothetical protein